MTHLDVILSMAIVAALCMIWILAQAVCSLHEAEREAEERDD